MTAEAPISEWKQKTVKTHRKKIYCLGWSADGRRLASGSIDRSVKITRVDEHCAVRQDQELTGHTEGVTNLDWHPTHPDKLASIAQPERSVRFWDTRSGKNTATVSTPGDNLYLAWAPDGQQLAVANKQDVVALVDIRRMKVAHKYAFKYQVNEVTWAPAKGNAATRLYLASGPLGEVKVFDYPEIGQGKEVHTLRGHTATALSVAVDPAMRYVATGGGDALACLWDMQDRICLRTYYKMDYPIRSLCFSHDSRYLCIAGEEPAIVVENVETGESLGRLQLRTGPEDAAWNPRHHMLAFGGEHGKDERGIDFGAIEFRWKPS